MSRTFLVSLLLALCLTFTLSVAQPEMPSPPSPDMYEDTIFEIAQLGATSFGLGYGGGGKGAFPVGAFGANVGLPAVPAVPLAIASGGGKGKHGGGGYGGGYGGGGGHGKKGGRGPRLGFLIAAPVPVAQPYGGQPHQPTTLAPLSLLCLYVWLADMLRFPCVRVAVWSACECAISEGCHARRRIRIRVWRERTMSARQQATANGVLHSRRRNQHKERERVGGTHEVWRRGER